jgi:hypothetical protein
MDAEQIATAAVLLILFGVPLGLLGLAWHLGKPPKEHKPTEREQYPDEHLFI